MTEEEAKKKWCPFVRMVIADSTLQSFSAFNAVSMLGDTPEQRINCIGSDCMAWRKLEIDPNEPMPINKRINSGYCGLAGKP